MESIQSDAMEINTFLHICGKRESWLFIETFEGSYSLRLRLHYPFSLFILRFELLGCDLSLFEYVTKAIRSENSIALLPPS
jgi:hypothetical protein